MRWLVCTWLRIVLDDRRQTCRVVDADVKKKDCSAFVLVQIAGLGYSEDTIKRE